jgi:hypothetical protein
MFIPHILHHCQCMSGTSATTREMWSSRSRVECQPEFESPHRQALLQSGILSLGALWGVGRIWRMFEVVILEILLDSFGNVWPDIVGVYHSFPTISCTTKGAYFGKNVINMVLASPLLSFRQKRYQVESMWIPHHCQYRFRTADRLSVNCWRVFLV